MVNPISESCWDHDIHEAILSLTSEAVRDHTYWHRTVDRVEAGLDPEKTQTLTMTALRAWVTRCKSEPTHTQEEPANDRKTRRVSPQNGHVPNS